MQARRGIWRGLARHAPLAVLVLLALPFAIYATAFGLRGLWRDLGGQTYLYTPGGVLPNAAIFGHMLAGAVITLLAPLQLVAWVRLRHPRLHRVTGRAVAALALVTASGGLVYIAVRGTVGGPLMDVGFAGYGLAMLVAAVQTARHARARRLTLHRAWALRLFVLAIASWLFRVHYTVWVILTGGLWMEPDFSGAFDRVQVFAFYLPYLAGLELWLRRRR